MHVQGLDKDGFEKLLVPFARAWNNHVSARQSYEQGRKRRFGGGRKARLCSIEDKLLFILFHFKIYPLYESRTRE